MKKKKKSVNEREGKWRMKKEGRKEGRKSIVGGEFGLWRKGEKFIVSSLIMKPPYRPTSHD